MSAGFVRGPSGVPHQPEEMMTDEIIGEMHNILGRLEAAEWAVIDQRFWHTVAHGDKCCCVLPALEQKP